MTEASSPRALMQSLQQALDLLEDYKDPRLLPDGPVDPLPSLLAQSEELCAQIPGPAPVRSIHQFACTGGTLIAKSVALMPQVTLLSEIDPLSSLLTKETDKVVFAPSDIIYAARTTLRPIDDSMVEKVFGAAIRTLYQSMCDVGRHLVLRDHAHSQFCTDIDFDARPTLREQLLRDFPVRSIGIVRHPLDSYLSLRKNGWVHFSPDNLEEYCRRYTSFLRRYKDVPIFCYEAFVNDPEAVLQQICATLDLTFQPGFTDLLRTVHLSGDSGRSSDRIEARPRREVPEALQAEAASSQEYARLCETLGYPPDTL